MVKVLASNYAVKYKSNHCLVRRHNRVINWETD